jgi:hypothetical protein
MVSIRTCINISVAGLACHEDRWLAVKRLEAHKAKNAAHQLYSVRLTEVQLSRRAHLPASESINKERPNQEENMVSISIQRMLEPWYELRHAVVDLTYLNPPARRIGAGPTTPTTS